MGLALARAIRRGGLALLMPLLALTSTVDVRAQSNAEGYLYGSVAPTLGATHVTAVNTGTGMTRTATVQSDGSYTIPSLPIGTYTVTAKKSDEVVGTEETASVGVGGGTAVRFSGTDDLISLDKIVVSSGSFSPIDVSQTGASLNLQKETVDVLPVARNLTAISLLAPGTSQGDEGFGDLASFAGASVAENNVYINGFNVTNFRNGLGFSQVPFDFQESFQVMVGGYGPEYGRSTGGVTNVTTKSGSNNIVAGANAYWEPDQLSSHSPDVYYEDGHVYVPNSVDYNATHNLNAYAGFPIWKNHLFFYGIYNLRNIKEEYAGRGGADFYERRTENPFWGMKVDYQITDNHRLEYTGFSDKRTTDEGRYDYDFENRKLGEYFGESYYDRGGKNHIARYSGTFTEAFRMSLLYGQGEYSLTDRGAGDDKPAIYDGRSGSLIPLGSWTTLQPSSASDEREAYRADGVLTLGKHTIKFGYDFEDNISHDLTQYSGGVYYRYYNLPTNGIQNGAQVPGNATALVRERRYTVGGSFKVQNSAYYIQDDFKAWDDKLLFSVGLRNEAFKNFNREEKVFVEANNQIAPRVSVSYDPTGEGKAKIYANYGLYYLPIASNTNIRASGGETDTVEWYAVTGIGADGMPVKTGGKLGDTIVNSDGVPPDPGSVAATDLEPMYQSEYIIGVQYQLSKHWTAHIRGTHRNLDSTIDDILINNSTPEDPGVIARWAKRTGKPDFSENLGPNHYVLFNPGKEFTFMADTDGNGTLEPVTLTKADLLMPEAVRKYYSLQFILERQMTSKWYLNASYTWAHSYGNFEGWVKSDTEQDDAGLTSSFDLPEFMANQYGDLPNDRRHAFKLHGAYKLTDELTVGFAGLLESGRALNQLGSPRTHAPTGYEGAVMLAPRGSAGRTPWTPSLDLSFTYKPMFFHKRATFAFDVFNVFDTNRVREVWEVSEDAAYNYDDRYLLATNFQKPRRARVSVSVDF